MTTSTHTNRGRLLSITILLGCMLALAPDCQAAYSLIMTNGYGDVYRMNLLRDRASYQAYRGVCTYRGFSLSGCATTGEVVMLRIPATATMPEHFSILSTSIRWGTTTYVLNDLFRWLNSTTMAGYENWYPFDMSCSVAMYINSGGFGSRSLGGLEAPPPPTPPEEPPPFDAQREIADIFAEPAPQGVTAYSLIMTNGYGDVYRMNLLRDRDSYQAYRGACTYRGFSLSGCSTTGEVVMLRIRATATVPEHFSLVSTSIRWGTTTYFLNDVFRWLNSTTMAGYENWYPFDMSCSVAMYINSGGFGSAANEISARGPQVPPAHTFQRAPGGTNVIGALLPLTGDVASQGLPRLAACQLALAEITNTPGMPPIKLIVEDTMTDPMVALEKLQAFYTQGVQIVIGPTTSAEAEGLLEFANTHGMLLLASSPTAVPLAIPGDHLMRLIMDDSHQARRMAAQIMADGITNLAMLTRSDLYGEGLRNAFVEEYNLLGGHIFITGYCPRVTQFLPEVVSNLNTIVTAQRAQGDADSVGLLVVVFDEGEILLEEAAAYPSLLASRWYGTDGLASDTALVSNAVARIAARQTQLLCSQPAAFTNAIYGAVQAAIEAATGAKPPSYAMYAYDSLWLAALALRDTGESPSIEDLKQSIRTNAASYAGATGPIQFNSADDRADGAYEFLVVSASNTWQDIAGLAPNTPNVQQANAITSNRFSACWSTSAGATNYLLDVAGNSTFDSYLPGYSQISAGPAHTHVVTNLAPGQTYYYRVQAANAIGASPYSATMTTRVWEAAFATNGVPLWWLGQFYAVSNNADELALSDSDRDHMNAWEEFVADTSPISSNSYFAVRELQPPAADTLVIAWQGVLNRLYTLSYAEHPLAPWSEDPLCTKVPGTGGFICHTSSLPATLDHALFRLTVEME